MTTEPTHDGALGWLPGAQQSYALGLELWGPLESRLTRALANMHEGTFLVCEVPGATAPDGGQGRKYLQYALDATEHGRRLTAEASALKYQVVTDPTAQAQQALIDAMGWTRPDDDNHRRMFAWPLGVEEAVAESMRILRDVWAITHPALVRIGEEESFGHPPLSGTADLATSHASITAWVGVLGGSAEPLTEGSDVLLCRVADALISVRAVPEDDRLELQAVLGTVGDADRDAAAILRAVSEEALTGCVRLSEVDGGELLELDVSMPLDGLTIDDFARHVLWLAGSAVAVEVRLEREGVFGDVE